MTVKYSTIQQLPKKKLNHFSIYNKITKDYDDIKYLIQAELAIGWKQILPTYVNKKLINHFNIILAFLPENLWSKITKVKIDKEESYRLIKNNNTQYTLSETNQDPIMINLYNEIKKSCPNKILLQSLIDELDESLYSSWLVLRSQYYINNNIIYNPDFVVKLNFV